MPAKPAPDFSPVHARLRTILEAYAGRSRLAPLHNNAENFILEAPQTESSWNKPVWFGGVQTKKNYVSFHLMPVYVYPELLQGISPELKKRMQGKSCFNFKAVDEPLFTELAALAEAGYQRYVQTGLLKD